MSDPYLIAGHIRRNLRTIEDNWPDALHAPATGASEIHAAHGACDPISAHVLDVRSDTHHDLRYWCRYILDEVNNGDITHGKPATDDIPDLCRFIDRWALALAEQHPLDADNLNDETRKHADRIRDLARGARARRIEVGRCPNQRLTTDPTTGLEELTPCKGTLWATLRERDNGLLPQSVMCDQEPEHEWSPAEWPSLGRRLGTYTA